MNKESVALVTGASTGIGAAITKRLARQGLRVFGTSRNPQLAQTMEGVEMLPLDVRSDESVEASVETVMARTGRLDILINNVGFILIGAAEEVSIAEAKEEFETNFFGTMRLVRTVLPMMRKQGDGRIINMSGPAGIVSVPFMSLFSASKAALEGYSLALRQEVKQFGIHVSLILPGPIQTQVVEYSKSSAQRLPVYEGREHRFLNRWKKGYKNADQPAVVAEKVWNILSKHAPKAHYTVGKGIGVFFLMRRLIPETLFEKMMRRALGLDADVALYIPFTGE